MLEYTSLPDSTHQRHAATIPGIKLSHHVQGFGGEPEGKRELGRPSHRWEVNIKMDIQEVECGVWTGLS